MLSDTKPNISNNENEIIQPKYNYHFKIDLMNKIKKIKKKEILVKIFLIITEETKVYTQNENGIFLFFHNLSDNTYEKLNNYINSIFSMYLKKQNNDILDSYKPFITEKNDTINNIISEFSVHEKQLIKKKQYNEYLQQNQSK
jgi:hypothetical protein